MKRFTTEGFLVESIAGLLSGGWGLTYGEGYLWASDPNKDMIYKISAVTGIEDANKYSFEKFRLLQNYPNPFSGSTVIHYSIGFCGQLSDNEKRTTENPHVVLKIYDLTSRLVRTLVDESQKSGHYKVDWDGQDDSGRRVAPGVYFYKLITSEYRLVKKLVILR